MSQHSENESEVLEDVEKVIEQLESDIKELYSFRDLFFENHPLDMATEKNKLLGVKKAELLKKFDEIDVDKQIPFAHRAHFLYMKGKCHNVSVTYDAQAVQCLSKAVKLNPSLIEAWNELGECYWKNMNVKDAKASFEGALRHKRNGLSLRCLSIIMRQESSGKPKADIKQAVLKSVELAKEAVAMDIKDGLSWNVLGNAYLCQYFSLSQDSTTLKSCMTAYKQAEQDPVMRGQPDFYYNRAIALKYEELYNEALSSFNHSCRLDPAWSPPKEEFNKLKLYLSGVNDLVRTRGKMKAKKLQQTVVSMDKKALGEYTPGSFHKLSDGRDVTVEQARLDALKEGANDGKVILGKVIGSIHNEDCVPFTFAIVDESMQCASVTVYNWANGCGAIIGDCVCIPEPYLRHHKLDNELAKYDFKSIRINNPMSILINGKRVNRNQFACTRVSSTYEIH